MPRRREGKTFDTVDSAMVHADQLAAKLEHNRSTQEIHGASFRGEEVYRAPLTNRS